MFTSIYFESKISNCFLKLIIVFFAVGIRIVRPTEVGVIETLGKYRKTAAQGFHWIIPVLDKMSKVDVTEVRVDIPPQEVITKDKFI